MSKEKENLVPNEYWAETPNEDAINFSDMSDNIDTDSELYDAILNETNEYLNSLNEWDEMDSDYFEELRHRFNKTDEEIGQRKFKTFLNKHIPIWVMVIPAGRQHNGERSLTYYHTITEDMEQGECNGSYALVSEDELREKFNINYND